MLKILSQYTLANYIEGFQL